MARDENPPFARGATWYNGDTIDTNDLGGLHLEGKEWVFEDINMSTGVERTNKYVTCRVVRNSSGIALLPKRLAAFEIDATNPDQWGKRVAGYSTTTAAESHPIDEWLPTSGVVNNDLFYVVMKGPAVVLVGLTDLTADTSAGDWLVAITAATSQATTAGRVALQLLTGATAPLANQVQNRVGRALSVVTTQNTNSDLLLEIGRW